MIYTITVIRSQQKWNQHCVGFYTDFQTADLEVINNGADIHEASNEWAVIEAFEPGLYPRTEQEWWYEWDEPTNHYKPCVRPQWTMQVSGWGMG
jgi:hypothetical protein